MDHQELIEAYDRLTPARQDQLDRMLQTWLRQQEAHTALSDHLGEYTPQRFKEPTRLRGMSGLPQWKRRLFTARQNYPIAEIDDATVTALTQDESWPLNRIIRHKELRSWIVFSTTYLRMKRARLGDPRKTERGLLAALRSTQFKGPVAWPLDQIPQSREVQQSETYRLMAVCSGSGLATAPSDYPIKRGRPARESIDVTRLRHLLYVLGLEQNTEWATVPGTTDAGALALRTPYFIAVQELEWSTPGS